MALGVAVGGPGTHNQIVFTQLSRQGRDHLGRMLAIRIDDHEAVVGQLAKRRLHRRAITLIVRMPQHRSAGQRRPLGRRIGGTVVDYHDLESRYHLPDLTDHILDRLGFVIRGYDHREAVIRVNHDGRRLCCART
jgi:hypothetical protein